MIDPMTGESQRNEISVFDTLKRQKSPTRGNSKFPSASQTQETSKPCHMKMGSHTKRKTVEDADPDDSDGPAGEESHYGDDDRRPDRHRRPDKEEEGEETDRSVGEMTPSMKELQQVTGQKHRHNAKKSQQLATATGLVKIRDS